MTSPVQFLVGRDGKVYGRYSPKTPPMALKPTIEELLQAEYSKHAPANSKPQPMEKAG